MTPFNFWDFWYFDAKRKLNEFSNKTCSSIVGFLIQNLMKKTDPVVNENIECECRDISILIVLTGKLGLLGV